MALGNTTNGVCYCRITAVLVGYGQAYEVGNVACGSIYKGIGRYGVGIGV